MTGCGKEILASPCAGRTLCRYFAQSRGRPRKESSSLPAHRIAFSIKARSESAAEISAHFCSAPSYRGGSASSELIASIPISKISSSGRFLCNDVVSRCFRGVLGFRLEQVGLCMEYIKTCIFQELSPAFPGEHGEDYFVAQENVLHAAGRPGLGIKWLRPVPILSIDCWEQHETSWPKPVEPFACHLNMFLRRQLEMRETGNHAIVVDGWYIIEHIQCLVRPLRYLPLA